MRRTVKYKRIHLATNTMRLISLVTEPRVKLLTAVYKSKVPMFIRDIIAVTNLKESTARSNLRYLEKFGFLDSVRKGRYKAYFIRKSKSRDVRKLLSALQAL